jgi:hypothetical protein
MDGMSCLQTMNHEVKMLTRNLPLMCSTYRNTSRSVPDSLIITGFVTRVTRRVPLVEQELLTIPEYLSSPPVLSRVMCKYLDFEIFH